MKTMEVNTHITVKNVLFATDFSRYSNAALPYALAVAHQYGVKLFAAHVLSQESYLFTIPEGWDAVREQQQHIDANRLEQQLRGVPHQILTPVGDISDVIFRLVRDNNIDLLVLGTHGRSGLPKLLLGSVAEKIFRQSPVPVLTVGPHVPPNEKTVAEFTRIVFATDFSDESLAGLPYAFSLAQEHQAHLSLLHVLKDSHVGTVDLEANADFAMRRLHELAPPNADLWFQPEYFVEFGNVEEQIRNFVGKHGTDLIVLGVRQSTHNMAAVTHFSNSMTHRIVAYATCPVLTVRG
jgi:nucleotide-binding universal stress UspA family protein